MVRLAKLPKSQLKFKSALSKVFSKVSFKPRVVIPIVSILVVLISIPIGVYLLRREQNPEIEASVGTFTMSITSGSPSCGLACFDGSDGDGGRIQPCGSCCSCNCIESAIGYANPTIVDPGESIDFSVTSNQSFTNVKLLEDPTVTRPGVKVGRASDSNRWQWSYPGSVISASAAPGVYTAGFKGVGFNDVACIYADIVYEVNGAPTGSISASATTVAVGETVTFTVDGADINNDLDEIKVHKSPTASEDWGEVGSAVSCAGDGASCPGTVSWTPTEAEYENSETWYVVLNVFDDIEDDKYNRCTGNSFSVPANWADCSRSGDTDAVTITLTLPQNADPVCNSLIANPTDVTAGDDSILTLDASDPDGDTVTVVWTIIGNGTLSDTSSTGAVLHTSTIPSLHIVTATLSDGNDGSGACDVTITAAEALGCTVDSDCEDDDACTDDICDVATGICTNPSNYVCGDGVCECGEDASNCFDDCGPVCDTLSYVDFNGSPFIVGDPFSVTCTSTSTSNSIRRIRFGIVRESDNAICKTKTTNILQNGDNYSGTVCYDPGRDYCDTNDFSNCTLLTESGNYFVYSSVCIDLDDDTKCTPFGSDLLN